MATNEVIVLKRDCPAVQIPSGHASTLSAGTEVTVTQTLGGYTVSARGALYLIAPKDADALGFSRPAEAPKVAGAADEKLFEQRLREGKAVGRAATMIAHGLQRRGDGLLRFAKSGHGPGLADQFDFGRGQS